MNKADLLTLAFASFLLVSTIGDSGMKSKPTLNQDGGGGRPCTETNLPVCPPPVSQAEDQPYFASNFSTSESVITTHTRAV